MFSAGMFVTFSPRITQLFRISNFIGPLLCGGHHSAHRTPHMSKEQTKEKQGTIETMTSSPENITVAW